MLSPIDTAPFPFVSILIPELIVKLVTSPEKIKPPVQLVEIVTLVPDASEQSAAKT